MENINWDDIQCEYNLGLSTREVMEKFKIKRYILSKAIKDGKFKPRTTSEAAKLAFKLGKRNNSYWTHDQRKKQSDLKKKLYQEYPEKHPNRKVCGNFNKLTYPEKLVYTFFKNNNVEFTSHEPLICGNKTYWPDFIINKKLIIEIDGEKWHSSIEQKKKDNARDLVIESYGYKIIRLPAKNIIENIKNIFPDSSIDNINYTELKSKIILIPKKEKEKYYCKDCNSILVDSKSGYCRKCVNKYKKCRSKKCTIKNNNLLFSNGKSICIQELKTLILEKSMVQIGYMYGVSDNAIRKRCKALHIEIPKHKGDWIKTVLNEKIMNMHKENKSIDEISKIVNKTIEEIQYIINKKTKVKKLIYTNKSIDKEKVINMYCDGYSERIIAKECNCSKTGIRFIIQNWIKHYPI